MCLRVRRAKLLKNQASVTIKTCKNVVVNNFFLDILSPHYDINKQKQDYKQKTFFKQREKKCLILCD